MRFNLKLELTDINVFGLVLFFVIFFSQTAFAQLSCSNPINGFCKVVPTEKFDMDNGGLVLPANGNIPPSGTPQNCKAFNEDPKHSCAVRFFTRYKKDNVNDVVNGIVKEFESFFDASDLNKFKNKLQSILNNYRQNFCNGGAIKACVTKNDFGSPVKLSKYNNSLIKAQHLSTFVDAVNGLDVDDSDLVFFKNASEVIFKNYDRLFNEKFLNLSFNSNTSYPTYFDFVKKLDKESFEKVFLLFKESKLDSSINGSYYFSNNIVSTPIPAETTNTRILFKDSSDEFDGGQDKLLIELSAYLSQKNKSKDNNPNKEFVVFKITITASSSTGSNTKNFCQKDFKNLNLARVEKVKQLIIDNFKVDEKLFSDPNVGGLSGDGSSGKCAYECVEDTSNKTCIENKKNPPVDDLNDFQRVTVTLARKPIIIDDKEKAPFSLSLKTKIYSLHYGCFSEAVKECYDSPSNIIK